MDGEPIYSPSPSERVQDDMHVQPSWLSRYDAAETRREELRNV